MAVACLCLTTGGRTEFRTEQGLACKVMSVNGKASRANVESDDSRARRMWVT